jgi:hypothetical protein
LKKSGRKFLGFASCGFASSLFLKAE